MSSIVDWQRAGVQVIVELSTTPQLVLVADPVLEGFMPGGSDNVPLGWSPGYWGMPPATSADVDFATTAGGVFSVYATTSPGTDRFTGCYRYITAQANVRYQFQIECRVMTGKMETGRYVEIAEWNGVTANVLASTSFTNISNTSFEQVSLQANRAVNVAGGFTQLRIRVDGVGQSPGTTRQWGVDYQNPVLYARALSMPTITWRDITCDVKALDIRYGRERFTNRYDAASMQFVLNNEDGQYSYADPHPFNFGPGRQIRVRAVFGGTSYPMGYCITDTITDAVSLDGRAVTNVASVDPTTIFASLPTPATNVGGGTATVRLTALADVAGYLYTAFDGGVFQMKPISASGRSIRDEMGITSDSEGGSLFADRSGNIVFKDRRWLTTDDNLMSVTANLWAKPESNQPYFDHTPDQPGLPTICTNRLVTDWTLARVVNSLSLANVDGTAKTYFDRPSMRKHGERTYQRHDFVLNSSSDLDARANDIMTGYTQPKMRLNALSYRADLEENDWPYTLRVFLNWLVRVWYQNARTGWGWLIVTHVQSVTHHITPTEWEVTLQVDQPSYYSDAPIQATFAWDDPTARWDTTGVWV